jgi:hypothetical protein
VTVDSSVEVLQDLGKQRIRKRGSSGGEEALFCVSGLDLGAKTSNFIVSLQAESSLCRAQKDT